jgi:hypothetical protein
MFWPMAGDFETVYMRPLTPQFIEAALKTGYPTIKIPETFVRGKATGLCRKKLGKQR